MEREGGRGGERREGWGRGEGGEGREGRPGMPKSRVGKPTWMPEPIFTRNTSNDAVPRKDVPFQG